MTAAVQQSQKTLIDDLWRTLAAQPERLAERAFVAPFKDLSALLTTAAQQGQKVLMDELWRTLAAQPKRLAERAFEAPFSDLSALLTTAAQQGQKVLMDELWRALAAQSERLAERMSKQPDNLMSFLSLTPVELKKEIFQHFKIEDWAYDSYRTHRDWSDAASLAAQFGLLGRDDLKNALIDNILRRRNPRDFYDPKYALLNMARLLSLTAPDQKDAIFDLLKIVCTAKWLAGSYKFGSALGLAGALHMIVVHQPPSVIRLFWNHALGMRLEREWSSFEQLGDQGLNAAVQLLGTSSLAGWAINRAVLFEVPLDRIGQLPETVRHRPEAQIVEQWQRQLWFGLRVIASIGPGPLHVAPAAIIETLKLWQKNIDGAGDWLGTKDKPDTTAHRINVSMVNWLEDCAQTKTGRLLPIQEPLWVLAGFPRVLASGS